MAGVGRDGQVITCASRSKVVDLAMEPFSKSLRVEEALENELLEERRVGEEVDLK